MRLILCVLLAAATGAAAQTPARPPKPHPSQAPRATPPRAPRHEFWGDAPMVPLPGEPFGFEFPSLLPPMDFELSPLLPMDMHLDLAPLAHLDMELQGLQHLGPMALDHSWSSPPALMDLDFPMQGTPPAAWSVLAPGNWGNEDGLKGALGRLRPDQGSPEDSIYRAAREALNRGEYSRASALFQTMEQKYPKSRMAPAVLYYRAFALYRAGATPELEQALAVLKMQQERFPDAAADPDAATLRTRLQAALAARGNADAARALQAASAGGATCDREDIEVRAEALNALAQINPPEARPTLRKVLARRDECSVALRRRAVYILGRNGSEDFTADLLEVAKSDPDAGVRSDAIMMLARSPGASTIPRLEDLFNSSTDERTREAALSALRSKGGPDARKALKRIIERNDVSERMRAEAISQLGGGAASSRAEAVSIVSASGHPAAARRPGEAAPASTATSGDAEEDAAYLRSYYSKAETPLIKTYIIAAVARIGGPANDQWVLNVAKNRDEDMRLRREALSRLRSTTLSADDLGKLFDSLSERELRSAVLQQLARREEPAATDRLIEIARSGTDPQLRREAISALARKNDPRTTKLLLDLLEKP